MAAVAPGTAVWFDHPVERWVPATVAEAERLLAPLLAPLGPRELQGPHWPG